MSTQATQPILTSRFWEQLADAISTKVQDAVGPATENKVSGTDTIWCFAAGDDQLRLLSRVQDTGIYYYLYEGHGQIGVGEGILHTWSIFWDCANGPTIASVDMQSGEQSDLRLEGEVAGPLDLDDRRSLPTLVGDVSAVIQGHLARLTAA